MKNVFLEDHTFDTKQWLSDIERIESNSIFFGADIFPRIENKIDANLSKKIFSLPRTKFISSTLIRKIRKIKNAKRNN